MARLSHEAGLLGYGGQAATSGRIQEEYTDSFSKLTVQNSALILVCRHYLAVS